MPNRFAVVFASICLLIAPVSHAQSRSDAQRYLAAAEQLYESLEYERAMEQLQKAKKLSVDPDTDVQIALLEGVLLSNMGKPDEAEAAFRTGLVLQPDAKMPLAISPKLEVTVERIRAEVKKSLSARPRVVTEPTDGSATSTVKPETNANIASSSTPATPATSTANKSPADASNVNVPSSSPTAATTTTASPAASSSPRRFAWIPAAAAVASAGVGVVFLVSARQKYDALGTGEFPSPIDAVRLASDGKRDQTLGFAAIGVSAAALAVSAGLFFAEGEEAAPVAIAPTGNGVAVSGVFP